MAEFEYSEFSRQLSGKPLSLDTQTEEEIRNHYWMQNEDEIRTAMATQQAAGWQPATELGPEGVQLVYDASGAFKDWNSRRWLIYLVAGLLTGGILFVVLPFVWQSQTVRTAMYRVSLRREVAAPQAKKATVKKSSTKKAAAKKKVTSSTAKSTKKATAKKTTTTTKTTSKKVTTKKKAAAKKSPAQKKTAQKKATAKKKTAAKKSATKKKSTTKNKAVSKKKATAKKKVATKTKK